MEIQIAKPRFEKKGSKLPVASHVHFKYEGGGGGIPSKCND